MSNSVNSMYRKILALSVVLLLLAGAQAMAKSKSLKYEVTATNITKGQIFSPAVVVSHRPGLDSIFRLGEAASSELAAVAEDAALDPLISKLEADPATIEVGTLLGINGPILPGETASIMLDAGNAARTNRISLVGMLVTTNDGFYGLDSASLELPGSYGNGGLVTFLVPAYDAGSERNSESCAYIPGPPCGNHNHDASAAEGYVHIHSGIHGIGDLNPADFDWHNPVAKITIRLVYEHGTN